MLSVVSEEMIRFLYLYVNRRSSSPKATTRG
jgi:hypothetical protein